MKIGPLPDAMDPGFHCVRTHWIRGFMTFRQASLYVINGYGESMLRITAMCITYDGRP